MSDVGSTRRIRSADGFDLAVHDLGGRGQEVVFVHATGMHGLVWRQLAQALGGHVHSVALDLRGHGGSGAPSDSDFSWSSMAHDIEAVIDDLGLERPVGVGHSSGATTLLLAEEQRPGTFGRLYCYEPVIVPADPPLGRDPTNWLASSARRRREVFDSREEALTSYASKPAFSRMDAAVLADYVGHGFNDLPDGTVQLKCRRDHEALVHELATDHDCFSDLGRIRCPVLVAGGGESEAFTMPLVRSQLAPLADVAVEVLPGLGHLGPLEHPQTVARSIHAFIA